MSSSVSQSLKVRETSARPTGLRVSVPLKMTSAISSPRSDLADCSPSTQRTASSTLDFPQPLGPTMAVMPSRKLRIVLSANDLKPSSSSDCRCIVGQKPRASGGQYSKRARVTSEKHTIWRVFGGANHSILRSGPGFELQIRTPRSIEKSKLSVSANFRNPEYPNHCNARGDRNSAVAAKLSSHSCLRQLNHAGCTDGR